MQAQSLHHADRRVTDANKHALLPATPAHAIRMMGTLLQALMVATG